MYREQTEQGRKPGLKSTEQKEEINIQPEQNKETRIQKNEERRRNTGRTLNIPISES